MTNNKMIKPIVVVGSLNMDLVAKAERLPAPGETVFGRSFATFPGGKGGNQAVAAAKLGGRVSMVACVGNDGFGRELIGSLREHGVDTSFVSSGSQPTGTALITVDAKGANTIVVNPGANQECKTQKVREALEASAVPGILLVQHEVPEEIVDFSIRNAKNNGWLVILNPAPARRIAPELLPMVDIMTPNETEAAVLTGRQLQTAEDVTGAAGVLLQSGVKTVIITLGEQGAVCFSSGYRLAVPPVKVEAVDTTAAGDAYTGALALALAEGQDMEKGLHFAAAAAALSVTRAGAQPALALRQEVEDLIAGLGREEK